MITHLVSLFPETEERAMRRWAEYTCQVLARMQVYLCEEAYRVDAQVIEPLEHQAELNQTLDIQLASYRRTVEADADQFLALIDNAFDPGAIDRFAGSVALARSAVVPEDQILKTVDDVDAFFM